MWDNLQKKDWIGPSVYIICQNAMESTAHLLLQYEYAVSVWANCMHFAKLPVSQNIRLDF